MSDPLTRMSQLPADATAANAGASGQNNSDPQNSDPQNLGLHRTDGVPAGWAVSPRLVGYDAAVEAMQKRVADIADGTAGELVWLLEHPPLYTAGVSAKPTDLREPNRFPVHQTGRGGQYTYHGPGQRVVYVMVDLNARRRDVRAYVQGLESMIITALFRLGVSSGVRDGRVGVWVDRGPHAMGGRREDKIAAIGVKLRRWVSFHGVALNVCPDLSHFSGITPCGIHDAQFGVTSLRDLADLAARTGGDHPANHINSPVPAHGPDMVACDQALRAAFETVFGPTSPADPPV